MLTKLGISTTFLARYEPRRATAGGTMRTPEARISASSTCENLVLTLSKNARSPACEIWFSFKRNDSSTAFLTHWLTVHWPTPWRSATRMRPLFRSAMTCSTASRTSGLFVVFSDARFSQASSIVDCSSWVMEEGASVGGRTKGSGEGGDALRGFEAFVDLG